MSKQLIKYMRRHRTTLIDVQCHCRGGKEGGDNTSVLAVAVNPCCRTTAPSYPPPPPLRSSFPCVITYVRRRGEAAEAVSKSPSRLDGQRWRCGAGGPAPPPPMRSSFPWLAPSVLVVPLAP